MRLERIWGRLDMSFNEWDYMEAQDFCIKVTDGTHDSPKRKDNGKYLITSKHIKGRNIDFENAYFISEDDYNKINLRSKVEQWDVLISMIGEYCGFCYIERNPIIEYAVKNVGIFKTGSKVKAEWIYYYLNSPISKNRIASLKSGTSQPYLSLGSLRKLRIPIPKDRKEMKAINNVLSTLDEKIEINNQINKKLGEIAQSNFKRWFVDFDFPNEEGLPYKSSGGEMVDSELGMIPKEWKVGVFRDYIENTLGGDWGKESPQGNYTKEAYCLRGADIPEVREGKKGALPKRYILKRNLENKKLSSGDLVVEISGGSHTQSTGRITYISDKMLEKYDAELICTNFCRAIILKNKSLMGFIYYYWTRLYNLNVFFQFENGTTGIKNFDINTFLEKFQIVKPPAHLINKFNDIVMTILDTIQFNGSENEKLTTLRDTLLPKLMSGEIDLSNLHIE